MSVIKKPMLAEHLDPAIGTSFPVLATPKVDGIRCLRIDQRTLSRKFLDIPNKFVQTVADVLPDEIDGELITFNADGTLRTFSEVQSDIMSEEGAPNFKLYVFDYVPESLTEPYDKRMKRLEKLDLPDWCVKLLPKLINTPEELDQYEAECLAAGWEGCMIRSPKGPYKCGRATAKQGYLLKVKRFLDSEAEVIGFEEQMKNTNEATVDELGHTKRSKAKDGMVPANTLGKFLVREIGNTPWKGKTFGCGTGRGMTAQLRKEIWDHRDAYLGKIITYKYQKCGTKDLPRIPVWHGFRSPVDMS